MEGVLIPGQFYLFACAGYWTFVGRYIREVNYEYRLIEDALYFTKPGATFDVLSTQGLQSESIYHAKNPAPMPIPARGPIWQWFAATPWVGQHKGKEVKKR